MKPAPLILFVFVLKEIEVRPAGVLGVEVLLAAILETETLVEPVGGCIFFAHCFFSGNWSTTKVCASTSAAGQEKK